VLRFRRRIAQRSVLFGNVHRHLPRHFEAGLIETGESPARIEWLKVTVDVEIFAISLAIQTTPFRDGKLPFVTQLQRGCSDGQRLVKAQRDQVFANQLYARSQLS
jgi:hypothetical protein